MWLTPDDLVKIGNDSGIIGRALLVCQKFEATCKDIIASFEVARIIKNKEYEFMSPEYVSYVDSLHRLLLGVSIKKLATSKNGIKISENQIIILEQAKNSRNWIVHESGKQALFTSKGTDLEELINHVKNVVLGDFLVSSWSYSFYEGENPRWIEEIAYLNLILYWVLS
ncbi:hypothetical protein COJ23_25060 [Priestia megaterium]|uniref:hypothetical protein n=1 Tax=Priestia megaterium TaxID=1404 RepID=UPI000BF7831A|nr:hypothetical protein [Priestia megaterium]PFK43435.1 hypothetical protein COJ23_25060 [Priestia megaterium]